MEPTADLITRRQALTRVAYLLGGTLSASTIAGVLAGCGAVPAAEGAVWLPRTLSPEQAEMVLIMGEHILPETDTPGARAARVDRYIDAMLTDYYDAPARQRFLSGLERVDARALRAFGSSFAQLPPERQLQLSQALNRAAFQDGAARPAVPPEQAAQPADPVLRENDVDTGNENALPEVDRGWSTEDVGRGSFFRTLKELVLVGYYTSEAGATRELRVNPMGTWRPDVPYAEIGQAWA
jgi:gluconate 2-dehydrogenase gamma chain